MSQTERHMRLQVPCDKSAPAVVRRALSGSSQPGWMIGDLMLVASELVANAVRHSGGTAEERVLVEVCFGAEAVLLSVIDPGSSGRTAVPARGPAPFGGMGLRLVEQLAARWGSERVSCGRHRVWAELAPQA